MKKKLKDLSPLSARDITRAVEDAGYRSLKEFARKHKLNYWNLIAVMQRDERVVCQEIREFLADFMRVDVSRIGRERKRSPSQVANEVAA